jgi:hypothetical protein
MTGLPDDSTIQRFTIMTTLKLKCLQQARRSEKRWPPLLLFLLSSSFLNSTPTASTPPPEVSDAEYFNSLARLLCGLKNFQMH